MLRLNKLSPKNRHRRPEFISFGTRIQALSGNLFSQVGWTFFTIGSVFMWIFGGLADFQSLSFSSRTLETGPGVVSACHETNSSEDNTDIYRNEYSFIYNEVEWPGTSYSTGTCLKKGREVVIEIVKEDPSISRIKGMRSAPFSLWIVGIVAIFPMFGLLMIAIGFRSGLNMIRRMEQGRPSPYSSKNSRNLVPSRMAERSDFQTRSEDMEWSPADKLEFEEMERELDELEESQGSQRGAMRNQSEPFDSKFPSVLKPFPMKSQVDHSHRSSNPSIFGILKCLALPAAALMVNCLGYYYYFLI
jgi:hypothetical protein